jgi:hypothetical protein
VTLLAQLDVWTLHYRLSLRERRILAEAIHALVELGELAAIENDAPLAAKLGAPTLHAAAHRLIVERLMLGPAEPAPVVELPVPPPEPKTVAVDKRRRCSVCRELGHKAPTCPLLSRRA